MLRDTALEIFVVGGHTHMLSFATRAVRDQLFERLVAGRRLPNRIDYDAIIAGGVFRDSVTTRWQARRRRSNAPAPP